MIAWIRYEQGGEVRFGVLDGDQVRPIEATGEIWQILAAGDIHHHLRDAGPPQRVEEVHLKAITDAPASIRDFMSFEEHVSTLRHARGLEVPDVWYQQPVFYFTNPAAIHGPTQPVRVSPGSNEFDYELEIAVLLKDGGSNLTVDEAAATIGGYVLFCDWSARDLQLREYPASLGPAKGKDSATTLGPYLVEPAEFESWRAAHGGRIPLRLTVNGIARTDTDFGDPYWSFPQMISYASRGATLRPGDIIASGTVGTGCLWELRSVHGAEAFPWLQPDDVVEISAGPLGTARTLIEDALPLWPLGDPAGRQG